MFFHSLLPLLDLGYKLSIVVESATPDKITVGIHPVSTDEKKGAQVLAPSIFTGTAAELDAEFPSVVMPALTGLTRSLAQQIEDARIVAEATAAQATEAALKDKPKTARPGPKTSAPRSSTSGQTAADDDGAGEEDVDSITDDGSVTSSSEQSSATSNAAVATPATQFGQELPFSL